MAYTVFKIEHDEEVSYIVWSSVTDSPVTFGLTKKQVEDFFVEEAAKEAREHVRQMLERADASGTSSRGQIKTFNLVSTFNQAGPDQTVLTSDEMIEFYCRRKKDPSKKALEAYRRSKKTSSAGG